MRRMISDLCFVAALLLGIVCAAQAQFNSFPPGVFTGRAALDASGGGGACSPATDFLARVSTSNTTPYQTMICGMVTDGTWSSFDILYLFATDTAATALTNLTSSSFTATTSGSPTFTAAQGYTGNGTTTFINTGYNYSTGTNFKQNSAGLFGWSTQSTSNNGCPIGESDGSFQDYLQTFDAGNHAGGALNGIFPAITVASGNGLTSTEVTNSTTITVYRNGSSIGTASGTTSAPQNATAYGLQCNTSIFANYNVAMIGVSSTLGATGQANVYSRIHAFLNTINPVLFP